MNINFQFSIFNFQKKEKWRGFTLIELLVVISIIVILITMGMTSFTTAQRKGRDAKRKSDLREIKNALEQYYSICSFVYPTPAAAYFGPVICSSPIMTEILNPLPVDPRSGAQYVCPDVVTDNCNANKFSICTTLESESPSSYCIKSSQ